MSLSSSFRHALGPIQASSIESCQIEKRLELLGICRLTCLICFPIWKSNDTNHFLDMQTDICKSTKCCCRYCMSLPQPKRHRNKVECDQGEVPSIASNRVVYTPNAFSMLQNNLLLAMCASQSHPLSMFERNSA